MERLCHGLPVADKLPDSVRLYLMCCPSMDLQYRFLPRAGGLYDQDYVDMKYFGIIEQRIKEILARNQKRKD